MRVAVLEKFIYQILSNLGLESAICAIPHGVNFELEKPVPQVTYPALEEPAGVKIIKDLCSGSVDADKLNESKPDLVLTSISAKELDQAVNQKSGFFSNLGWSEDPLIISYSPKTLNQVYEIIEDIGKRLQNPTIGRGYAQKVQAQFLSWADNFYDRTKRKKVTFIKSVEPLILASGWITDMIQMTSAISQTATASTEKKIKWSDIIDFKPDVIIVAPYNLDANKAYAQFKILEKLPNWDDIPAVKRGEVYFSAGDELFYQPGVRMIDSMAIIVSAIAGLDSGYITKRDSFQRLRWLEMQRHKF
jgi:iron complex transport system substrate-binding protein